MKYRVPMILILVLTVCLFSAGSCAAGENEEVLQGTAESVLSEHYTDAEEITCQEAVAVLTGLGILNGMGDGTFQPKALLTRAQTAKLIDAVTKGGNLSLTGKPGQDLFEDVTADHWASGYIYDGIQAGYLHGMGDGTFCPEGTVTTAQMAVILDKLLGIRAADADRNWPEAAMNYAENSGLLNGLDKDASEGLTREEAAQMIYNALQADQLQITEITEDSTGDSGFSYISAVQTIGNDYRGRSGDRVQQYIETCFPDVNCRSINSDGLGHRSVRWESESRSLSIEVPVEPAAVITRQITAEEAAAVLGDRTLDETSVYINGCRIPASAGYVKTAEDLADQLSGNGIRLELYSDETGGEIDRIVVLRYQLKEITASDCDSGTVTIDTGSAELKLTDTDDLYDVVSASVPGDRVLAAPSCSYYYSGGKIRIREDWTALADVYLPEIMEGSLTGVQKSSGTAKQDGILQIDGKDYTQSWNCSMESKKADRSTSGIAWLDREGYVEDYQTASEQTVTSDWILLKELRCGEKDGQTVWYIKGVTETGEIVDWKLSDDVFLQKQTLSAGDALTAPEKRAQRTAALLETYRNAIEENSLNPDYVVSTDRIYLKDGCAAVWNESADGYTLDSENADSNEEDRSVSHVVEEYVPDLAGSIGSIPASQDVVTIKVYGNEADSLQTSVLSGLNGVTKGSLYIVKNTSEGSRITTAFVEVDDYETESVSTLIRVTGVSGRTVYHDHYGETKKNGYLVTCYEEASAEEKTIIVESTSGSAPQTGWYTQMTIDGDAVILEGMQPDTTVSHWDNTTKNLTGGFYAGTLGSGYNGMISTTDNDNQVYFFTGDEAVRDLSGNGIHSVEALIEAVNQGTLRKSKVVFAYTTKKDTNTISQLYILN